VRGVCAVCPCLLQLRSSAAFRSALTSALAVGNFLNWGTRLGGASGFRLRNLAKLQVATAARGFWYWWWFGVGKLAKMQVATAASPGVWGLGLRFKGLGFGV
jgi:hypothetical protein